MTSPYTTAGYFVYWKFPTAAQRTALTPEIAERGKVAYQEDNNSFWVWLVGGWYLLNAAAIEAYIPTKSYDGEVIPLDKQRLVYGDFEIIGSLELIGDLVIL